MTERQAVKEEMKLKLSVWVDRCKGEGLNYLRELKNKENFIREQIETNLVKNHTEYIDSIRTKSYKELETELYNYVIKEITNRIEVVKILQWKEVK